MPNCCLHSSRREKANAPGPFVVLSQNFRKPMIPGWELLLQAEMREIFKRKMNLKIQALVVRTDKNIAEKNTKTDSVVNAGTTELDTQ